MTRMYSTHSSWRLSSCSECATGAPDDSEGDFDSSLPKVMWVTSEEVARYAVQELDRGSLVAIPGLANQLGAKFSQVAPRRLLLEILKRMHPALK